MANWGRESEEGKPTRLSGTITYQVQDTTLEVDWEMASDKQQTAIHRDEQRVPGRCTPEKLFEHQRERMLKTLILHEAGWQIKYTASSTVVMWEIPLGELSSKELSRTIP